MAELTPADRWRAELRAELLAARKARATARVSALRSALAAIDNAETPDVAALTPASGPIAGAVTGLGAAEVARKTLSDDQIRALIFAEIAERRAAAGQLPVERADRLREEAEILVAIAYQVV